MIDQPGRGRLAGQLLFVLLFLCSLFIRLLPVAPGRIGWPGPEMFLCLTLAWMLRRPHQIPVWLIAAVFLIEDVILWRPFGLWAAIVLLATEWLRSREVRWREMPFMFEWLRVAALFGVMILARRFVMALSLSPQPILGEVVLQYLATVAGYPVVVLGAYWLIGLRRTTAAEAEMMRNRA